MICAIIPIKHESTRVPKKNYRDFNGSPLYYHIIKTLLDSKYIDTIVIDTNSDVVKQGINEYFTTNKIIIYDRPEYLWAGDTPVNKLLINVIESLNLNADFYIQTHTTNPLLKTETLDASIETFLEKRNLGYDSLFSVKKIQTRFYHNRNEIVSAINHNPEELIPTQDLEPMYEENSCIYLFTKNILVNKNHRVGYNPYLFIMNDTESQDIDTEYDFFVAKLLHREINKLENNSSRILLLTGVNGGIGKDIAKKYKDNYWKVIGTDLSNECVHEYCDTYISCDLTNKENVLYLIQEISNKYEKLDCIVNNAAVQFNDNIWNFDEDKWDMTMDCNLKIIFLLVKHAISLLTKSEQGNIINVASIHSVASSDKIAAYACSKSGIVGLTKNLSIELADFNIRVNAVSPGAICTEMLKNSLLRDSSTDDVELLLRQIKNKHPLKDIGYPENVASLIMEINNNNFINGANYIIDGGVSVKLGTE